MTIRRSAIRRRTIRRRTVAAAASVAVIATAVGTALYFGPPQYRVWLGVSGILGLAMTFPSLFVDPRDLLPALVFSAAPVMALVSDGAPTWLIAPLAVLLLLGGELNAYCWESDGPEGLAREGRQRLVRIAQLGAVALVASLAVAAAAQKAWLDSTAAVAVAASALVGLAWVILPGGGAGRDERSSPEG